MSHHAFAFRCAHADPSRTNAVMCLRNLVEQQGLPLSKALGAVMSAFPLGLSEIAEISAEAQKRYAEAVQ